MPPDVSDGGHSSFDAPIDNPSDNPDSLTDNQPQVYAGEKRKSAWILEEEDGDGGEEEEYVEECPEELDAGASYGKAKTSFEKYRQGQESRREAPFHPFADKDEWDVVRWLVESGTSQQKKDEFLKLKKVSVKNVILW
jgi:hypothetical protein